MPGSAFLTHEKKDLVLFRIEDLLVFDDATLRRVLSSFTIEQLAASLQCAPPLLVERICRNNGPEWCTQFIQAFYLPYTACQIRRARHYLLDSLFWELTYWKTPELYDQLTAGEYLHPGIFLGLEPVIHNKIVLDIGAGSGRATFECLRHGAALIYAIEPSPGLLHILQSKVRSQTDGEHIISRAGSFEAIPLADNSVDVTISCSAFTAMPGQGGEAGLAEMLRVTRSGGKIVVIWPRKKDYAWLTERGFRYVAYPLQQEMHVYFRSMRSALTCVRRFYAHNQAALHYLLTKQRPELPFSVLGLNPPCDYFWRDKNIEKDVHLL